MTRYELLERIGHGGMAEIYKGKAVAAGGFEKPVAIKRILPHLSQDERFVRLLIAEANLLSQLRHRNIVQIFDMGLGEDGQYFLVMEYVDGTDLGALFEQLEVKRKRLPVDLALHIAAEVCEALHHAHLARRPDGTSMGLVHRDVSPANILISVNGEVKLTDFGIAKQKDELTGHGSVRGKFAYISPEQAANEHVDARSDVYSVAIVLYELLLGHRLFSSLPDFDALRAVRAGEVKPPRQIDSEFDPELERLLMQALALDPARRPESAGAFGSALRGYRYNMPTLGADPAKELARLLSRVERSRAESVFPEHEPTVLRIQTAAGFTSTGFEVSPALSGSGSFLANLEFDDDETTAARPMHEQLSALVEDSDPGARMTTDRFASGSTGHPTVPNEVIEVESADMIEADSRSASAADTDPFGGPGSAGRRVGGAGVSPALERAATPTVRELFYGGELLEDSVSGGVPVSAAGSSGRLEPQTDPRKRRRNRLLLLVAVVAVGVGSFFLGSAILAKDETAAPPAVDAGVPDAAPPPDAPKPAVRKRPKRKRIRRKRPRRKSTKKRSTKQKSTKKSTSKKSTTK